MHGAVFFYREFYILIYRLFNYVDFNENESLCLQSVKNSMTCSKCTEPSEINKLLNLSDVFFNHCCISSFGIFSTYFGYIRKHSYKVYILSELSIKTIMLYRKYCIEKIEETTVAIIRILNSENLYFYTKFNNYAEDITRKAS